MQAIPPPRRSCSAISPIVRAHVSEYKEGLTSTASRTGFPNSRLFCRSRVMVLSTFALSSVLGNGQRANQIAADTSTTRIAKNGRRFGVAIRHKRRRGRHMLLELLDTTRQDTCCGQQ